MNRRRVPVLILCLLPLGPAGSWSALVAVDSRLDSKPEYTRFVATFNGAFKFENSNNVSRGSYFSVNVPQLARGFKDQTIQLKDGLVDRIVLRYDPKGKIQQFLFHLQGKAPYEITTMRSPDRLVVDVLRNGRMVPAPPEGGAPSPQAAEAAPERVSPVFRNKPADGDPRVAVSPDKWTVVIDPGHGGRSLGAVSPRIRGRVIQEKEVVLKVALELADLIRQSPDMECYLTRRNDAYVSLEDRVAAAKAHGGDVFISLHCNSVPSRSMSSARGVEFYYLNAEGESKESVESARKALEDLENDERIVGLNRTFGKGLLGDIFKGLAKDAAAKNSVESRKLCEYLNQSFRASNCSTYTRYNRGVKRASFLVLRVGIPAMLLEIGYISNGAEAEILAGRDFQVETARRIYDALRRFKQDRLTGREPLQVARR